MAVLSGKELDRMVADLRKWYADAKDYLVAAISRDYPYGTVKLNAAEQLRQYMSMTQEHWAAFIQKLRRRYRGYPDAEARVFRDLQRYVRRMEALKRRGIQEAARAGMTSDIMEPPR